VEIERARAAAGIGRVGSLKPTLQVIVTRTRPGRIGLPIGQWFQRTANAHGAFDVEWVDLAEWNLPFMDEPHHPRLRKYTHEHTKRWSTLVERTDAVVFVMPEYNHGYIAPLKNAIDYLLHEWSYKPVGFVTYGGVVAGTRAMQLLLPVLVELRMTPCIAAVNIARVSELMKEGEFHATESVESAAQRMLSELVRMEAVLRDVRVSARQTVQAR
jgi:NAD(P)H-dependent FMN reductase